MIVNWGRLPVELMGSIKLGCESDWFVLKVGLGRTLPLVTTQPKLWVYQVCIPS